MSVKINSFELENVKRIKAVQLTPGKNGLTVIGGRNGQGKTSVIDALAWALGGDRFKPSSATREGSVIPPHLKVELSNGIVVERSGDSSRLKVIDASGNRGGQQLLNEFIEQLALDLPRFMEATSKEKAATLLNIIGVGEKVYELEEQETTLYNRRTTIGQIADQKAKYAKEMPVYSGVPEEPISAAGLIQQQQDILAKNAENQRKREHRDELLKHADFLVDEIAKLQDEIAKFQRELDVCRVDLAVAAKDAETLMDESTAELEENIRNVEEINAKVRANVERKRAADEAADYKQQYDGLTEQIETVRAEKIALLNGADLPLEGLSVENGELTYLGKKWDGMSASEQLKVSTAIVRKLNPKCGFVLMDKLEQMDTETLNEFGAWLESEGLQVIATRVSTGDECSVIIEDGLVKPKEWKAGSF